MSKLFVQQIEGPNNNANRFPDGLTVTAGVSTFVGIVSCSDLVSSGIVTADSFSGSGANLTGILPSATAISGVNTAGFSTFKDVKFAGITTCVGIVSCTDIVSTGIVTAKAFVPSQGQLTYRNLIVNGDCNVAQRGISSTSTGYQSVDRFKPGWSGQDEALTQAQHALTSSDSGPWGKGFRNSFHLTNGDQTSGAGAADNAYIYYYIEAKDIANSGWNYTSTTDYITLSFWVRSSVAQTFYGYVKSQDGTAKLLSFSTGSLSANTWKKIEVSIPGHADLQFDNNADAGFQIAWAPFFGTDYTTSGHSLNSWMTYSGSDRMPDNTSTWWTTDASTFEVTGVQLEVGQVATPFEHKSFSDNLLACQRYCIRIADGDDETFSSGACNDIAGFHTVHTFIPEMRTTPSASITTGANYYTIINANSGDNVSGTPTQVSSRSTNRHFEILWPIDSNAGTQGAGGFIHTNNAGARFSFSAEL